MIHMVLTILRSPEYNNGAPVTLIVEEVLMHTRPDWPEAAVMKKGSISSVTANNPQYFNRWKEDGIAYISAKKQPIILYNSSQNTTPWHFKSEIATTNQLT